MLPLQIKSLWPVSNIGLLGFFQRKVSTSADHSSQGNRKATVVKLKSPTPAYRSKVKFFEY